MPIFTCPNCHRTFNAPNQSSGQKFECDCGQRVQIPPAPKPPSNKTVLGKVEEELPWAKPLTPPVSSPSALAQPGRVLEDVEHVDEREPRRRKKQRREREDDEYEDHEPNRHQRPTVIEQTSKYWKMVQLLGALACVVGTVIGCSGRGTQTNSQAMSSQASIGAALVVCGIMVLIYGRIGAWWNHG